MPDVELTKADNIQLTAISLAGNVLFCIGIVILSKILRPAYIQNRFIWLMLSGLLVADLCLVLWLRKRNRILYRNQLFISALSIPFIYGAKILLAFIAQ
jgi:hypothetical protein